MRWIPFCWFFWSYCYNVGLWAQDTAQLNKYFRFTDGVYLSWNAFRQNRPEWPAQELSMLAFTNPKNKRTVVEWIRTRQDQNLPIDSIIVLVRQGVPFLALPSAWTGDTIVTFVPLKVRGKICYLTYPDTELEVRTFAAFNPKTGRPFRRAVVQRSKDVIRQKIVFFPTGEILDFTKENLRKLVADDPTVAAMIDALPERATDQQLYHILITYDSRHPVWLPISPRMQGE